MKMKSMNGLIAASLVIAAGASAAHAEIVYPGDPNWGLFDNRPGGLAAITDTYPRDGDGSLELTTTGSLAKAGYGVTWDPTSSSNLFGTPTPLSSLMQLSYEWYRDSSSTVAGHLAPSLQLAVWTDLNNDPVNNDGEFANLVYEFVYNSPPATSAPTDLWVEADYLSANVWQFRSGTGVIETYNLTVDDWLDDGVVQPANSLPIDGTTLVYGIRLFGGSGWTGDFNGAVDNVSAQFGNEDQYVANFEPVPEPSVGLLTGLGIFGLLRRRRNAA